ncbi:MAG: hypothetical protein SCK70_15370, partial [bacterium]|nr:hypothetical protein [bacterium]
MRIYQIILIAGVISVLFIFGCQPQSPDAIFRQFNEKFFAEHTPEFPGARLLTKHDLPQDQRRYFDEEDASLQLLLDLNQNGIPEYIVCGISDSMLIRDQKGAYFIA